MSMCHAWIAQRSRCETDDFEGDCLVVNHRMHRTHGKEKRGSGKGVGRAGGCFAPLRLGVRSCFFTRRHRGHGEEFIDHETDGTNEKKMRGG